MEHCKVNVTESVDNITFPITRFRRRFSAVLLLLLSVEGCGCLVEDRGRFTLSLRSIGFLRGLRGIIVVSCGSLSLQNCKGSGLNRISGKVV